MPVSADIYGQIQPVQQPNTLQEAALASQLQQGSMKGLELARTITRQNALEQALGAGAGAEELRRAGFLDESLKLDKDARENRKADADAAQAGAAAGNQRAQMNTHHYKLMGDMTNLIAANPTPETVGAVLDQWEGLTGIKAGPTRQAFASAQTPDQIRELALRMNLAAKDQLPKIETRNTGGRTDTLAFDVVTGAPTVTGSVQNTQSPDNAASVAATIRGQNMTDKRFREMNAAGESTPESEQQLNYWSDVLRKGGSLPPGLARGPGGSAFVREVTKRAAMGGTSPDELMANQAEFAGSKAGQRTLGTKQANIEMAATEAYNMMPIALAASNKVDRTNYPTLNKVLMSAEKGTGDESVVQLSVAVNSLVNSYSRAISPSGTPTVSDKEHAREILDKAYSKGQFAAAVEVMKQEIEQARKSPAQVRAHMRPGAEGNGRPAPAAAPTAPSGWKYIGTVK